MNYLVKWPTREIFALLVYVDQYEFKYCYTDQPNFTHRRIGDLHDLVSRTFFRDHATVIPTTASTIDEARSLHPELFI